MKLDFEEDIDIDEEDPYGEEQYISSSKMAHRFIDDQILPRINEFDYHNPDEDYIPGLAVFALYTRLIGNMIADGYSIEQLKDTIDEFKTEYNGETIH